MIRLSKSLFTVASQAWEYERVSKSLSYSSDAQANTAELLTECYLCASRSPVVVLTAVLTAFSAIFAVPRRLFRPQCHGKRRSKTLPTKKSSQKKQHSQLLPGLRCATGTRSAFHALWCYRRLFGLQRKVLLSCQEESRETLDSAVVLKHGVTSSTATRPPQRHGFRSTRNKTPHTSTNKTFQIAHLCESII